MDGRTDGSEPNAASCKLKLAVQRSPGSRTEERSPVWLRIWATVRVYVVDNLSSMIDALVPLNIRHHNRVALEYQPSVASLCAAQC